MGSIGWTGVGGWLVEFIRVHFNSTHLPASVGVNCVERINWGRNYVEGAAFL